jgi:hypothetical protein
MVVTAGAVMVTIRRRRQPGAALPRHPSQEVPSMKHRGTSTATPVALSTVDAVHRRDHTHTTGQACHPHAVEVIGLGHSAMVVCHDCASDTAFMDLRRADLVAERHRRMTA